MKQGEIWLVDLNPVKVSEQAGVRPVVIVSGNLANTHLKTVICCPIISKVKNYKGNLVLEPSKQNGFKAVSEILTHQIRSISKDRLMKHIGAISAKELAQIKQSFDEIWRY